MKTKQTDRMRELFHEIKMEETSDQFMEKLMRRIEKEAIAVERRKQINTGLLIASGIVGIVTIPAIIIYFLGIDIPRNSIQIPDIFGNILSSFKGLNIDSSIISIGLTILLLLIGDFLIRKHFGKANHNTEFPDDNAYN